TRFRRKWQGSISRKSLPRRVRLVCPTLNACSRLRSSIGRHCNLPSSIRWNEGMTDETDKKAASSDTQRDLAQLDIEFIRVLEDLINVLVSKGTINLTDLPPEALAKLSQRKRVRQRLKNALDLLQDDDDVI